MVCGLGLRQGLVMSGFGPRAWLTGGEKAWPTTGGLLKQLKLLLSTDSIQGTKFEIDSESQQCTSVLISGSSRLVQ